MAKPPFLIRSFFLFVLLCSSSCFAFDDGDFQYWNAESISWKLDKHWQLNLEEEFRFGDDAGDFYYQHSDLGATYTGMCNWLDIGFNYRHIFEENNDEWKQENRPHLNFALKLISGKLNLNNRGRFEYRNREDADNFWRYRNKFTLKFPCKFTRLEFQPYLADEIFVDFDQQELNRNRLYAGFYMKLLKSLKGEIFYLWQSSKKSGEWTNYQILGTKLKLVF